jgi:mannose-1-phosphate guanylyltransferase/mannose-6-phosphate isomerase
MNDKFAIILCGGSGTRLWPLSRSQRPKQLLPLNGKLTLLQQTVERVLSHVSMENLYVVTHDEHRFEVMGQLAEMYPGTSFNILAEPHSRNTLPAIAWGVHEICRKNSEAIIGVFPSDHAIDNVDAFNTAWSAAEKAAEFGYLALLGISPTSAATGYGYIQPENELNFSTHDRAVFEVAKFVEKPDSDTADAYVKQGFLWNSGMFVFKAKSFMDMLQRYQKEIFNKLTILDEHNLSEVYESLPNISIDYGLAEQADKVAVVPADMSWSDLGSWEAIHQKQLKNQDNNVVVGDVSAIDSKNNLLWSSQGHLATLGIDNLVVVQTPDATLVCSRSRAEGLKDLVSMVGKSCPELVSTNTTTHRPWGTYTVLEEGPNFKIKKITVDIGAKLSMQMHEHRSEHWVVVSGKARITNGEDVKILERNESSYIPKHHKHRLENAGDSPLEIIEVQCGDYVGEDDIIRFEDTYGRLTQ